MAEPHQALTQRERLGRRIRIAALSLVGMPAAFLILPFYLREAKGGDTDRWAPFTYAAVTLSMLGLPFWILAILLLLQ